MKRREMVIVLAVCVALLIAILTGCGGTGSSSGTTATAGAGSGTSATSAGASTGTLAQYKSDMKAWVDKYDADLNEKADALGTITDPMNATGDQIKSAKEFASLVAEAAAGLKSIQPPADLATYHTAYSDGLSTMAIGFQKYAEAVEKKDAALLAEAMGPMSATGQVEQAETNLEEALGFKLTSD